jgi:hypothetical protein
MLVIVVCGILTMDRQCVSVCYRSRRLGWIMCFQSKNRGDEWRAIIFTDGVKVFKNSEYLLEIN